MSSDKTLGGSKEGSSLKIPHTQIFYLLFIAVIIGLGVVSYQTVDLVDPQIQANKDNIDFLIETDKTILEAVAHQTNRSVENAVNITALQEYDVIIGGQVGDIRSDIKSKFPQAADVLDEGQSATIPGTPFLTLKMEKREFFLGNTIFFSGSAHPNTPIFLTLKDSERDLWQIAISKTEIIDGQFLGNYTLRLDDPIGSWSVYARQGSDTTKTLTFSVE